MTRHGLLYSRVLHVRLWGGGGGGGQRWEVTHAEEKIARKQAISRTRRRATSEVKGQYDVILLAVRPSGRRPKNKLRPSIRGGELVERESHCCRGCKEAQKMALTRGNSLSTSFFRLPPLPSLGDSRAHVDLSGFMV